MPYKGPGAGRVLDPGLCLRVQLGVGGGVAASGRIVVAPAPGDRPGSLRGRVVDSSGTALPGVTVFVTAADGQRSAVTQADGTFLLTGLPPGQLTVSTSLPGFVPQATTFSNSGAAQRVDVVMAVGGLGETITVTGQTPCEFLAT